jgi:hypothetical protein
VWTVVKAATAMWLTASAKKNSTGSCSLTCNEPEFAALPPGQIVHVLADRVLYIGSERSFYRVACFPPMGKPIGGSEPGQHRSPDWFHACEELGRIRCGAGTSPTCPPLSARSGCNSIW